jgi:hypothetical protein
VSIALFAGVRDTVPPSGAFDMTVWRIKLNSMRAEEDGAVDWDEAKTYCRQAGLVGVGWGWVGIRRRVSRDV